MPDQTQTEEPQETCHLPEGSTVWHHLDPHVGGTYGVTIFTCGACGIRMVD